jgi:hypothetical protein
LRQEGRPPFEATLEACRLRLRPILMTSFAFILGVVPLVLAEGAGAEMRRSLGTAVFSGMLGVTLFGVFLTPVFFYVIEALGGMSPFRPVEVRWVLSGLAGAFTGLLLGLLLWEVTLPELSGVPVRLFDLPALLRRWGTLPRAVQRAIAHLLWFLLAGVGAGALTALLVMKALRSRGPKPAPAGADPAAPRPVSTQVRGGLP